MYGLTQDGMLAQKKLENRLNAERYKQSALTPGFWTHTNHPICFMLLVDNFGVKYTGKEHAQSLMDVLEKHEAYWAIGVCP